MTTESAGPGDLLAARALRATQFEGTDLLFWRLNEDDRNQLDVYVDVSDVFAWGCADVELITGDNIVRLEDAMAEVVDMVGDPYLGMSDAAILFAARERGTRSQAAMYKYIDKLLHPLFGAAGPTRVFRNG